MARQDAQRYRAQLAQQEKELNAALERARELQLANTVLQAQLADTTGSFRQALETAAELLQVRGAGAGGCRGVGWGLGEGGGVHGGGLGGWVGGGAMGEETGFAAHNKGKCPASDASVSLRCPNKLLLFGRAANPVWAHRACEEG